MPQLVAVARPVKRFLRRPEDAFPQFIASNAESLPDLDASGFLIATALAFLDKHGIELGARAFKSECVDLQQARSSLLWLALTDGDRVEGLDRLLSLNVSANDLANFYRELHETDEPGVGEALGRTLQFLASALSRAGPGKIALVSVG